MASIDKRPDARYRAKWREYAGGPQKTRQFRSKMNANRFLDAIRGVLVHGRYVDPDGGRVPFEPYAEEWRKLHRPARRIRSSYLRLHGCPTLGKRQLFHFFDGRRSANR
jgi:hypothetical protein